VKDGNKLVLVNPDYPPPLFGGGGVYLFNLVDNSPDPFDIMAAPLPVGMREMSSPRHKVIRSRFLVRSDDPTTLQLFIMYLYLFFWVLRIGILREYKLVVFFTSAIGNGFFSALLRLLRIKIVGITLAEEIPLARRARGWKGMLKRLCIKGYPCADGFISNCDFAKDILLDLGVDADRICVIPSPICHSKYRPGPTESNPRRDGRYEVLTVGRLVKRKGVHLVIEAIDILRAEVPNVHLTVVGDGAEMAALMEQVERRGLQGQVTFRGAMYDDEELSRVYNSCDLFVLANLMLEDGNCEGTPNVLIEASAHRKPVIAGVEGGTSSAVKDGVTGYLIDPRDVRTMAGVMKNTLLDRELAARLGAAGRRKVEEEHDPVKAGHQFSAFLRHVIGDTLERI